MARKPQYGKILRQARFPRREDAEEFAKEMKQEYRDAGMSLRYDIARNEQGEWECTVYMKI